MSHDDEELQRLVPGQQILLSELKAWRTSFLAEWGENESPDVAWVLTNLLVYWNVCHIWLSTCTTPSQTAFDDHMESFTAIIDHAVRAIALEGEGHPLSFDFSHEMEVMSPLYFTATRCRHPILRRKALSLMRQTSGSQMFWASMPDQRVIERVIAIEEGEDELIKADVPHQHEVIVTLPPESRRLHHIAVIIQGNGQFQNLCVQLSKFKHNPDGSRTMVQENIRLDG
jgi:hypothetical protein